WNIDPMTIPARQWVMEGRFIKKFVSLIMAPGGASKSMLSMEEAVAVATGRAITGMEVRRSGAAWIFNNEDPEEELHCRLAAIYQHWGIDQTELENRIFVNSGLNNRLIVARTDRKATVQMPEVEGLKDHIRAHKIIHLTVDPFVRWHDVDEQDNSQIDFVVRQFASIADDCDCAISLVHHTRKTPAGGSYAGDADSARGASALVYACRSAHTLMEMTSSEAANMGIKEDRRRWYIRFDNAKSNLSPPAEDATWFERVSVAIPNGGLNIGEGDHVGVLVPWDAPSTDFVLTPAKATEILKEVDERWRHGEPFNDSYQSGVRYLVTHLQRNHEMTKPQARKVVRDWIENGMLVREQVDANSKKIGLRVIKWPGNIN
ncbi:MAG: helicase RepA family protein, partial [Proteobacteria bacterium]|nr:helicase RepA family protein [Pseudomonadota bacterium]